MCFRAGPPRSNDARRSHLPSLRVLAPVRRQRTRRPGGSGSESGSGAAAQVKKNIVTQAGSLPCCLSGFCLPGKGGQVRAAWGGRLPGGRMERKKKKEGEQDGQGRRGATRVRL